MGGVGTHQPCNSAYQLIVNSRCQVVLSVQVAADFVLEGVGVDAACGRCAQHLSPPNTFSVGRSVGVVVAAPLLILFILGKS